MSNLACRRDQQTLEDYNKQEAEDYIGCWIFNTDYIRFTSEFSLVRKCLLTASNIFSVRYDARENSLYSSSVCNTVVIKL